MARGWRWLFALAVCALLALYGRSAAMERAPGTTVYPVDLLAVHGRAAVDGD